ncbi:MAG: hypothetical protein IPP82_04475 [Xanthomonadales bacterium]|nr:hypothetical protein [Xanthomonadales bacterium]
MSVDVVLPAMKNWPAALARIDVIVSVNPPPKKLDINTVGGVPMSFGETGISKLLAVAGESAGGLNCDWAVAQVGSPTTLQSTASRTALFRYFRASNKGFIRCLVILDLSTACRVAPYPTNASNSDDFRHPPQKVSLCAGSCS